MPEGVDAQPPSEPRERLLRTASRLFYESGIHAVGVDLIVTAAGVTRSTFYRHFPSKEDLVVAYLQAEDASIRTVATAAASRRDEPADALRGLVSAIGEQLCGRGFRGCPFINAAAEYPDGRGRVRRLVAAHREWTRDTFTHLLEDAGHPDPARGAAVLLLVRDGAMVGGYLDDPLTTAAALNSATEAVLAG